MPGQSTRLGAARPQGSTARAGRDEVMTGDKLDSNDRCQNFEVPVHVGQHRIATVQAPQTPVRESARVAVARTNTQAKVGSSRRDGLVRVCGTLEPENEDDHAPRYFEEKIKYHSCLRRTFDTLSFVLSVTSMNSCPLPGQLRSCLAANSCQAYLSE